MLNRHLLTRRPRRFAAQTLQRFFSTGKNELKPYFKPSMSIASFKTQFSQLTTF